MLNFEFTLFSETFTIFTQVCWFQPFIFSNPNQRIKKNSTEGRENWQLPCLVMPQCLLHLRNLYNRGWKVKLFFSCQIICFSFNFFFFLMKSRLSTILYLVRPCFILNCLQYWGIWYVLAKSQKDWKQNWCKPKFE